MSKKKENRPRKSERTHEDRAVLAVCPRCQSKASYKVKGTATLQDVRCTCGKKFQLDFTPSTSRGVS